jgi:hypothetical protein
MTDKIDDGGPAFSGYTTAKRTVNPAHPMIPDTGPREIEVNVPVPGMSLRDWFAGQALVGVIADETKSGKLETTENAGTDNAQENQYSTIAADAYALADAMLAARKEPTHDPG